ncbi:MAG: c-type cytochrome [Burkholderiales bacterium]|nr:MAG: c-type cytochrome [Burkholderiales bacterium]
MACGLLAAGLLAAAAPAAAQSAAEVARGKELVEASCFLCHGMQGESASELYPRLAGQHAQYIARQLEYFRSGARSSTQMAAMVAELTPADMRALGAYFEAQTPQPQQPEDPELAVVGRYLFMNGNRFSGVPACANCHGAGAGGTAELPRLAGQVSGYIQAQLRAFKSRARGHPVMQPVAELLTELEIVAIGEYLQGR